jgi:hypothetical protein
MYNLSFSFTHSSEAFSLGVGVNTQHKDKNVTRDVNLFLTRGIIKLDRYLDRRCCNMYTIDIYMDKFLDGAGVGIFL